MVTSEQLCAAIESLLNINYGKQYMTWRDTNVLLLAKDLVSKYRQEVGTNSPEDVASLRPTEARTYVDAQLGFDFSDVPESLRELASSRKSSSVGDQTLNRKETEQQEWDELDRQNLRSLAAYEVQL